MDKSFILYLIESYLFVTTRVPCKRSPVILESLDITKLSASLISKNYLSLLLADSIARKVAEALSVNF
jgi:hypothetical protein